MPTHAVTLGIAFALSIALIANRARTTIAPLEKPALLASLFTNRLAVHALTIRAFLSLFATAVRLAR